MAKINFEDNFEIYLFTYPNKNESSSKLGEFLSFLKFHKVNLPYKFSFVAAQASLIREMSLYQNILIAFSPNSLTESKEMQFEDFLKVQGNRALENLYHTISLPHELPAQSNTQMKKVCSLIKSLLSEGQFIFLEEPEVDLSPETLALFISALKQHIKDRQVNVLIYSLNLEMWMPHSHKIVERTRDYNFIVSSVARNYLWGEERLVFYAPANPESTPALNGLKFTVPKEKSHKKPAA
jgi:ABC-type multidrug transport system ATPase subunit